MSWMVSAWIKKSKLGSGTRKGVMLVVADYCTEKAENIGIAIPDGWAVCWAGVETIAAEAEVSERTVRRVLDDMEAAGIVRRERRTDGRGWRTFDFIWIEHARMFADLTGWTPSVERDNSDRTESPLGAGGPLDLPVDNPDGDLHLVDSDAAPTGLSRPRLPDSHDRAPIRNNHQLEPPPNHQNHLGKVSPDRAGARRQTRSSSEGGPAPPAPSPSTHQAADRKERHG